MRILVAVLLLAPLAHGAVSIAPADFGIEVAFAGDGFQSPEATDGAIYQTIVQRLAQDPDTRYSLTIEVSVRNGVVLLSGKVTSQKIRQKAEKLTHGIKGVKAVKNQLTVQKR